MTKFRRLSLVYIWNAFVFLILQGICSFVSMAVLKSMDIVFAQFSLCLPFLALLEIRRRSGNILVFFTATLAVFAASCAAAFILLSDWRHLLIILIYIAVMTGLSVYYRFASTTGEISGALLILAVVINGALSIASGPLGIARLEPLFITSSLIQFILYIIHVRISRLDYSLELIESTSVQPVHKIIGFNNLVTAIIALMVTAAALLSVFLRSENLVFSAGRALLRIIRYFAGRIGSGQEPAADVETPAQLQGGGFDPSILGEPKEPFLLWVILEKILYYGFIVLLIAGIIFGLGYLCYRIYRRFIETLPENGDVREFLLPEILAERTGNILGGVREYFSSLLPGGDNSKKVRRIFFKRVSGHISKGIEISGEDTTEDIREKIKVREDFTRLTDIYRKARYSDEAVSDDEVGMCKR